MAPISARSVIRQSTPMPFSQSNGFKVLPAVAFARRWSWLILFAVATAAADASASLLSEFTDRIASIWIANAIVAAVLLRSATVEWRKLFVAGFVALCVGELILGNTWIDALAFSAFNCVEIFIVTATMRFYGLDHEIGRPANLMAFYALALGPATITSSVLASFFLKVTQGVPYTELFPVWYASAAMGLATIVPIAATTRPADVAAMFSFKKLPGTFALFAVLAAAAMLMREFPNLPLAFLLFPVFLLFAVVRGFPGVAVAALLAVVSTAMNIGDDRGYIASSPMLLRDKLIVLQIFVGALCATSMAFASVLAERRKLIEQLKQMTTSALGAKDAAEHANQAKSSFLASMSHELRTPLNAILGYSEIMKDGLLKPKCDGECREHSKVIHGAGSHLLSLINDILDMSKIEAGKFELFIEPLDVKDAIISCVGLMEVRAHQAALRVDVDLPSEPVVILADGRAVRQIVLNLLSNALRFTPAGGLACVSLRVSSDGVVLAVRDTGVGISAKDLPRLGLPFEQVRRSADVGHSGTGLGLALVSALAKKHGGCMKIESKEGVGTTVTITLPRARAQAEPMLHVAAAE
ncbi:MAG: ATP-binding protein [Micropepsaceae bacterium]